MSGVVSAEMALLSRDREQVGRREQRKRRRGKRERGEVTMARHDRLVLP